MKAHQALSLISADDELWYAQFKQEKAERDYISGLRSAERKGRAEGRAEGLAKGERKNQLANASRMLSDGVSPELISKWTGLSLEEIAELHP